MLKISDKWGSVLVEQPEYGMGYWLASVFLRDGRRYDRVTIVGGIVTAVDGKPEIPFTEDEIVDIQARGR